MHVFFYERQLFNVQTDILLFKDAGSIDFVLRIKIFEINLLDGSSLRG
jgi:hypothetical protein